MVLLELKPCPTSELHSVFTLCTSIRINRCEASCGVCDTICVCSAFVYALHSCMQCMLEIYECTHVALSQHRRLQQVIRCCQMHSSHEGTWSLVVCAVSASRSGTHSFRLLFAPGQLLAPTSGYHQDSSHHGMRGVWSAYRWTIPPVRQSETNSLQECH